MPDLSVLLTGFLNGAGLIVAIGAQNAFVLRQGLRRSHLPLVLVVCIGADALLITAGTLGFGLVLGQLPWLERVARLVGGLFLIGYAGLALRRAARPGVQAVAAGRGAGTARRVLLTVLALTFLNPHVYLDTVVLLGSLANGHGGQRWWFVLGSVTASTAWFLLLGLGAYRLAPRLGRPRTWQLVDLGIGVTMLVLGLRLLWG